jgi:hypothetical protein
VRLYAVTGDGIARLDERDGRWQAEISLRGSGAQCLAVDPADPDTVQVRGQVLQSHKPTPLSCRRPTRG